VEKRDDCKTTCWGRRGCRKGRTEFKGVVQSSVGLAKAEERGRHRNFLGGNSTRRQKELKNRHGGMQGADIGPWVPLMIPDTSEFFLRLAGGKSPLKTKSKKRLGRDVAVGRGHAWQESKISVRTGLWKNRAVGD